MGWFISKKNKKKKKSKSKSRAKKKSARVESEPWDWERTLVGLKYVGMVLAFVALIAAWQFSKSHLTEYVSEWRTKPVTIEKVTLANAPAWMYKSIRKDLKNIVVEHVDADPMNQEGLDSCLSALQENAWIRYALRVERHNDELVVHALYRKPFAAVADPSTSEFHWIDSQGVQLPVAADSLDQIDPNLPVIVGVEKKPAGAGHVWPGKDVIAGLSLVQRLDRQPYTRQIKAIDVGARDDNGRIHIFLPTDSPRGLDWRRFNRQSVQPAHARDEMRRVLQVGRRTGVIWGLPPGDEQSIDPDANSKLIRLISVHDRYRGSIDARGKVVDISGAAAMVLQPSYE